MPPRSSKGLRHYRQRLDLGHAVIVGNPKLSSIVYCYRFPSRPDRIKIGYSSRGLKRVSEQSTAFPEKPEVLFVIHHARARDMEASFHEALSGRQSDVMGTEWFDASFAYVLKVSPLLRRAVGAGRLALWMKVMVAACFAVAGIMAYPAVLNVLSGMVNGYPLSQVAKQPTYVGLAFDGQFGLSAKQGAALVRGVLAQEGSGLIAALGALHIPILTALPFLRLRKQAA